MRVRAQKATYQLLEIVGQRTVEEVAAELRKVKGILDVELGPPETKIVVTFDPAVLPQSWVTRALRNLGVSRLGKS